VALDDQRPRETGEAKDGATEVRVSDERLCREEEAIFTEPKAK